MYSCSIPNTETVLIRKTFLQDRQLVRQALEENDFSIDESIIYTLQLMETQMTTFDEPSFLGKIGLNIFLFIENHTVNKDWA